MSIMSRFGSDEHIMSKYGSIESMAINCVDTEYDLMEHKMS